ncbi:VOC family protein [Saccharibacter sp. 17.LH.SD]|uniref:VOC family protein n=1 Tax=Saccharibacter sp. 17.LH.SD TaxID=2689393 RepID=UPI00136BF548|nr:VOC family protein [Saccharibacter sp. 17.LH.SD]MXV43513.1 VOC family protein [Saccharibacter sp. 17.LH.SD]
MFSHIVIGTNDLQKSKDFYKAIFAVIGAEEVPTLLDEGFGYAKDGQLFLVTRPIDGKAATSANGGTIGLTMESPEMVKAWHEAGVQNGGKTIEDPPGVREKKGVKLFLAYLRDPDGNKLCGLFKF